jgi:hypothetical protein
LNSQNLAEKHYSRADVQREIADFCTERWVAAHCVNEKGELVFRRYFRGKPLKVGSVGDFQELLRKLNFQVRSLYASANKYRSVNTVEEVSTLLNVTRCTPTWDVDSQLDNWRETIKIVKHIVEFLENEGVKKSVYMKWSGNGCHVHIHEEAFSENVLSKAHPLDLAYAIVEYVNLHIMPKISRSLNLGNVRVENRMDAGRVFTCPLSLHRKIDMVCVCFKPDEIDQFSPEWIQPLNFRHNSGWRSFQKGEADSLAIKAYEIVGGYPYPPKRGREQKIKRLDQLIDEWLRKF